MGRHAALMAEIEITADATCTYCAGVLVGGMRGDRFGWLHMVPSSADVHSAFPAPGSIIWRIES